MNKMLKLFSSFVKDKCGYDDQKIISCSLSLINDSNHLAIDSFVMQHKHFGIPCLYSLCYLNL